MSNNYGQGSIWRKWDLHIHTKGTQKADRFTSDNFDTFCTVMLKKALEKEIAAIGVTDYFNIDNYKKVKDYIGKIDSNCKFNAEEKQKIKRLFVLPNVELRILPATGSNSLINIHCIFNPNEDFLKKLDNDFFGSLEDSGGNKMNRAGFVALGRTRNGSLGEDGAYKIGIEKFHLEPSKLIKLFKDKPGLKENALIVISNSSNDGASALQKHYELFENETGSLDAVRSNIYKLSNAVFSGNPKDRGFFLGEKERHNKESVIDKCGSLKPCIHGSDAHTEEKLFNPDENRFCWIKADPTFEGLKQILCEPKDRVRIQANKPEEKSGYQVIKSISINNDICKQAILLNPNLNTIIGGRSTGKSTLLQLIAYNVNPKTIDIKDFIKEISSDSIKITWQDDEENKDRDIEFFPQNHMYEIASDKAKKNKLIQEIVAEKDNESLIKNYKVFCIGNKSTLQTNIDNLFELQSNIDELTSSLKEKGDKGGLEKEIESIKNKINKTHNNDNFSKDALNKFEEIRRSILETEKKLQQLAKDKNEIAILKDEDLFDKSFEYKFNSLSDLNSQAIQEIFKSVKQQAIKQWQEALSGKLKEVETLIEKSKGDIQTNKDKDIFKKGERHLEQNKQYKELNDRLEVENKKLAEIISIQKQLDRLVKQKKDLLDETVNNHLAYSSKINDLASEFALVHDDIEIRIEKTYQDEKCKDLLKDFINLQSYERQSFVNDWGGTYKSDIKSSIEIFLNNALENKIELKAYKDVKDLTKGLLTENWFLISYELTYQNDTFDNMSEGKKAFVILKLLLEFSQKKCPILLDQPEDSLDNRAIYNELVTYIKQKEKDRQIILVTHNANIVVNADAEEVIVANQHGEDSKNNNNVKFQYITGSLENTFPKNKQENIVLMSQGIREHVCEILEGGTEAFKKRENKYAIGDFK